jgi:hypothetical protein
VLYLHLPGRAQAGEGLHVLLWDQQEGMDVVARARVREGETGTPMVEVKTLTQLHRLELINL